MRVRPSKAAGLAFALLASSPALGQAILGTSGDGNFAVVVPAPDQGLPMPVQMNVTGFPAGANPHGVASLGANQAMVSDFGNSRVFVVDVSAAALVSTIDTAGIYNGTGTIATSPRLDVALAAGSLGSTMVTSSAAIIRAPFNNPTVERLVVPGYVRTYQTEAIVFNAQGRAFVYTSAGISALDPPYSAVAFTIPVTNPQSGSIAISPDGSTLLVTDATPSGVIRIFTAPFSTDSTPQMLMVPTTDVLDGISITPDGQKALVCTVGRPRVFAVSAPFTSGSAVEQIGLPSGLGLTNQGFEDVGISADGQLAIFTGQSNGNGLAALFLKAPFTAAGATPYVVSINGGRGAGAARFVACTTPPAPASPAFAPVGNGNGVITATDYLDLAWCRCGSSRFEWRINGDPYVSTTSSFATAPPRARSGGVEMGTGIIQLFVRGYACSPEKGPGPEASTAPYSYAPPKASFRASTMTAKVGESIVFTDTSSPQATSWLWLFGNTGYSSQQNPQFAFTAPGVYGVEMVATNGSGSSTSTVTLVTVTASIPAPLARAEFRSAADRTEGALEWERTRLGMTAGRHTWLTLESKDDAVVYLRISRNGRLLSERRLAVPGGTPATVDVRAYLPPHQRERFDLKLVPDRPVTATLEEEAP